MFNQPIPGTTSSVRLTCRLKSRRLVSSLVAHSPHHRFYRFRHRHSWQLLRIAICILRSQVILHGLGLAEEDLIKEAFPTPSHPGKMLPFIHRTRQSVRLWSMTGLIFASLGEILISQLHSFESPSDGILFYSLDLFRRVPDEHSSRDVTFSHWPK